MAWTILYEYPVTADPQNATPPTQAEAFQRNECVAHIVKDAVTNEPITHNMQLTTQELAQGFPIVEFEPLASTFYAATLYVSAKTANTITITGGSGVTTFRVRIRRPTSKEK